MLQGCVHSSPSRPGSRTHRASSDAHEGVRSWSPRTSCHRAGRLRTRCDCGANLRQSISSG
jgi:hypothetical protein